MSEGCQVDEGRGVFWKKLAHPKSRVLDITCLRQKPARGVVWVPVKQGSALVGERQGPLQQGPWLHPSTKDSPGRATKLGSGTIKPVPNKDPSEHKIRTIQLALLFGGWVHLRSIAKGNKKENKGHLSEEVPSSTVYNNDKMAKVQVLSAGQLSFGWWRLKVNDVNSQVSLLPASLSHRKSHQTTNDQKSHHHGKILNCSNSYV